LENFICTALQNKFRNTESGQGVVENRSNNGAVFDNRYKLKPARSSDPIVSKNNTNLQ